MACDTTQHLEINYESMDSTKWKNANVEFNNDENGFGYEITGSSPDNKKMGIFSAYQYDLSVPAFTRMRYSWKFKIGSHNEKHHSTVCLYYNAESTTDPKPNIFGAYVDFTNHYTYGTRPYLLVGPFINTHQEETAGWYYSEEYTKEFDFDNRDKASSYDRKLVIMLTHVTASAGGKSDLQETGVIKSIKDFALVKTDYFKIVTFNANGGEGAMDKDTIENSGHLTANAFTREGYYFMGWATSSDGAVEYADGAEITATAEDKGLDTLYAVWQQIITAVPTPKLGMVYNGLEKELINAGAANGGTMQYSLNNTNWSAIPPKATNAGTYTVYYRVVGHDTHPDYTPADNTVTATIDKATPTYTTRPAAKPYLKANGLQDLITAGRVTGWGSIQYKLGDGEWSENVPQASEIGNYYVYYKIDGDENHYSIKADTLITTIYGNKTVPEHDNYPYGGISVLAKQEGSNTDGNQHADKLFNGDADSYNSYNKWCSVTTGIAKYEDRPKDIVVWKTAKAIEMISYELRIGNDAKDFKNRNWYSWTIYGGEFDSDNAAKAALTTEEGWTIIDNQINDTVLKEVNDARYNFVCNNPGTYKYYRLVIHALHVTDSAATQGEPGTQQMSELTMGIEHVVPVYETRPSAKANLQYTTGDPQTLIEAGTTTQGDTILYQLEGGEWSKALPQASAKGNYYVYYKIQDSEIAPDTLIATIYGDRNVPEHDDYSYSNISVLAKQEGSDTSDDQRANKLFNDNDQTDRLDKWCSNTIGIAKYEDRPKDIVVWKTASAIEMISYELRTGNDTKQYPNRNWYSWTIYGGSFGSDDAAAAAMLNEGAWKIIDNQIKDAVLQESNNAQYDFACNNPGTYQYYRLVIHALHVTDSAKTQGVQQMQELTMGIEKATPPTGIDETIVNRKSLNRKFIKDGQLFILRDGKLYNAQGALVERRTNGQSQ